MIRNYKNGDSLDQQQGKGISTAGAVVAGAVVGATAGAVLANETARKKVIGVVKQIKDKAIQARETLDKVDPNSRRKAVRIATKAVKRGIRSRRTH